MGKIERRFYLDGFRQSLLISMDKSKTDDALHDTKDSAVTGPMTNGTGLLSSPYGRELNMLSDAGLRELSVFELRDLLGDDVMSAVGIGDGGAHVGEDSPLSETLSPVDHRPTSLNISKHGPGSNATKARQRLTSEGDERANSSGPLDSCTPSPSAPAASEQKADITPNLIDAVIAGGHTPLHEDFASVLDRFPSGIGPDGGLSHLPSLLESPRKILKLDHPGVPDLTLPSVPVLPPLGSPSDELSPPLASSSTDVVLSGKTLPTVTLNIPAGGGQPLVNGSALPGRQHASNLHVSATEIYRAYFQDKHWDEFKSALEAAKIVPTPVRMYSKATATDTEIQDVVPLDHVKLLLARRVAEQVASRSNDTIDDSGTGGVKTRHSDQPNISQFEINGETLPCIVIKERRFVRLVDIEYRLLQNGESSGIVTSGRLRALREACTKLGVQPDKCTPNEKARMVVYANSYRHNNLLVVRTDDLPRIVAYERRRRKVEGIRGKRDDRKSDESGGSSDEEQEGPKSPPPSPADRTAPAASQPTPASSRPPSRSSEIVPKRRGRKRKQLGSESSEPSVRKVLKKDRPSTIDGEEADGRPGPISRLPSVREDLNLSEESDGESGKETEPAPEFHGVKIVVGKTHDTFLAGEIDFPSEQPLANELKPCAVVVERSQPLPVVVTNKNQDIGPIGKYFDHLFVSESAACILCYKCKTFQSVADFVQHSHRVSRQPLPHASICMLVENLGSARFDLWEQLIEKLQKFESNTLYALPSDLSAAYESVFHADRSRKRSKAVEKARQAVDMLAVNSADSSVSAEHCAPSTSGPSNPGPLIRDALPGWKRRPGGNASEAVLTRFRDTGTCKVFAVSTRRVAIGCRDEAKEKLFESWYP